ncbi:MAG: ArsA family ATPase [Thermoplasmata archaeon]|nr:ArsA family ATPase [Thermoplasmata archaeon]
MRLIIYNGKGGVGKTSVSAATAKRLAEKGHRTIIMSVDTAHSLADSYDVDLGPVPVNIAPNLDVFELNIVHEMRTHWSNIQEYLSAFMVSQGLDGISADEMAIFPGMEMVAALLYVLTFKKEGKYDAVVIDTAPTGETLRLLSFPDVSSWYIDRLFGIVNKLLGIARFTIAHMMDIPLPSKQAMKEVEVLKGQLKDVKAILEDSENTTIRLVLNPERMAINETRRSYTYMSLYNKNVECLVINKVIPEDADGEFMKVKLEEQRGYMKMIHESFDPLRILQANMLTTEMRGMEKLSLLADMLFGDSDPIEVYSDRSPMSFTEAEDGNILLNLKVPFVEAGDIELFKGKENTIIVHIGDQNRTITLPTTLVDAEIMSAEVGDGMLIIKFRRPANEQ